MRMFRNMMGHRMGTLAVVLSASLTATPIAMAASSSAPAPGPAPTPTPAAAAATPERTVATFGDWTMTCVQKGAAPRSCEADTTVQDQQHQIVLALAIGRPTKDVPQQLVVQVPVNVRVTMAAHLILDTSDPVAVPFVNCNRLGCFAQIDLKDEAVLRRLRNRPTDTTARIDWQDSAGTQQSLPLSTRGASAALDALAAAETK